MSELATVARPYASAAFDFALEKGVLDGWQSMLQLAAAVSQDETVSALLTGNLAAEKQADLFIQICDKQLDDYGRNLLRLMAENGRLAALPQVAQQFNSLRREHEQLLDVDVTSAAELSKQQQQALSQKLADKLGKKVELHCSIDPDLVGGFIARAGDLVIDNSVQGQLKRLSDALQS